MIVPPVLNPVSVSVLSLHVITRDISGHPSQHEIKVSLRWIIYLLFYIYIISIGSEILIHDLPYAIASKIISVQFGLEFYLPSSNK